MKRPEDRHADRTRLIAAATRRGGGRRPVNPPVERASTLLNDSVAAVGDPSLGPVYGIDGLRAQQALEAAVADLEGAGRCLLAPSGLAAVTAPLIALTRPGDEVVCTDAVYGPTRRFLGRHLGSRGVKALYHRPDASPDEVAALITDRTRVLLIESPASLTFEMVDVPALARIARERGVTTVMDNTWAAGLAFRPLAHGVDVSVQALTKYVAGHSDVILGAIAAADARTGARIAEAVEDMGWRVGPDEAWLALRGVRTLPLRYAEHARSALRVARWLSTRPEAAEVLYPPLPGAPGHALWARDFTGAAGLMGVVLRGSDAQAAAVLDRLTLFGLGYSWGGFESLATLETHQLAFRERPPALEGALIRLHIGLEDPADLIEDLRRALDG